MQLYVCVSLLNPMTDELLVFFFLSQTVVPVIIEPKKGYTPSPLEIGGTLNITCKAKGNPPPDITWIKNSTGEIVASSTKNSKQLIITPMQKENFGVYSCIASNALKSTEVLIEVKEGMFADDVHFII